MKSLTLTALLLFAACGFCQTPASPQPIAPTAEVLANFKAHLSKADPTHGGDLILVISADASNGEHALIHIPLASTGHPYGEERSCRIDATGHRELIYTAGLDEANYMPFEANPNYKDFHVVLNKYLCRLLAAPFHCDGQPVALIAPWADWRLGSDLHVDLTAHASATLDTTPITTLVTTKPFNHAQCAQAAPSGGFCCVGGHTTEWHCGGTPATPGWQQVSGECFHRETPVACADGQPLPTVPRLWP